MITALTLASVTRTTWKTLSNRSDYPKDNQASSTKLCLIKEPGEECSDVTPSMTVIKMSQVIQSNHVNKYNILDGGQLLKWVDTCACLSAERMAGHPCVTVSVDDLHFENEVTLGQVLNLHAQVNRAFTTSMEIGVKVFCEDLCEKKRKRVCEVFITFVALDSNNKKVTLPPLTAQTHGERECFSLANERRKVRISHAKSMKALLKDRPTSPIPSSPSHASPPPFKKSIVPSKAIQGVDTTVESVELVLPPHANHHGNTFGGQVMSWMENVASISAGRTCRGSATLRSVDMVYFRGPSTVGDRIVLRSIVNNIFQSSLEVGVRVEAYRYDNGSIGKRRHINSAFLTYEFDNSSSEHGVVQFVPEPIDGARRQREAAARRKLRLDKRYILSARSRDCLSVSWNPANAVYLCYGNVNALSRLSARSDWKVVADTATIVLSTREEGGVLSVCATLKMTSPLKAEAVFSVLRSVKCRSEWDPVMMSYKLLEQVSEDDAIYHTVMRSGVASSVTDNDFVLLISDRRPSSDSEPYRVAIRSVAVDSVPPVKEYSRTEVICAGFVIRQQDDMCTEVSYYNELNPKLVSYVSCDVAGLSAVHCEILTSLQSYLYRRATT